MRLIVLIFTLSLLGSGCATHRPIPTAAEVSKKRAEAVALEEELAVYIRQLAKEEQLKVEFPDKNPSEWQVKALDHRISNIQKATEEAKAELIEIQNEGETF